LQTIKFILRFEHN